MAGRGLAESIFAKMGDQPMEKGGEEDGIDMAPSAGEAAARGVLEALGIKDSEGKAGKLYDAMHALVEECVSGAKPQQLPGSGDDETAEGEMA